MPRAGEGRDDIFSRLMPSAPLMQMADVDGDVDGGGDGDGDPDANADFDADADAGLRPTPDRAAFP